MRGRPQSMIEPRPTSPVVAAAAPPPMQRHYSQPQPPSMQEELKSVLDLWGAQKEGGGGGERSLLLLLAHCVAGPLPCGKAATFRCGKADNSSRHQLCSFFFFLSSLEVQKRVKTVQANMVVYVIWAINFKSDVRYDLRGCLEAIVTSKLHLCCSLIDGSSFLLLLITNQFIQNSSKINQKSSRMSPKILISLLKIKFSISFHVTRNSIRSEPCYQWKPSTRVFQYQYIYPLQYSDCAIGPLYMRVKVGSLGTKIS